MIEREMRTTGAVNHIERVKMRVEESDSGVEGGKGGIKVKYISGSGVNKIGVA